MKNSLLIFLATLGMAASAQSYDLTDPAIIGRYTLAAPDANSEVQWAEFYFDTHYKLSLFVAGIDKDLELQNPDAKGLVNKDTYEPVDCRDETQCGYVESSEAYLVKGKDAKGQERPELIVTAVESVYNDKTKDYEDVTTTYTLVWSKALPHGGLPLFSYDKKVKAVEDYLAECKPLAKGFFKYPSDQVFCPQILVDDVTFGMDEGVEAAVGGALKIARAVTSDELTKTFFALPARNIAAAVAHGANAQTAAQLNAEVVKLEAFFKEKSDDGAKFYYTTADYGDHVWIIDTKTKSIFELVYYKMRN